MDTMFIPISPLQKKNQQNCDKKRANPQDEPLSAFHVPPSPNEGVEDASGANAENYPVVPLLHPILPLCSRNVQRIKFAGVRLRMRGYG
jgi:hypothetical protein